MRDRRVDLERYRAFVPDWDDFVAAAGRPEPSVVRVRSGRADEAEVLDRLGAQGFRTVALEGLPGFHRVEGPRPVSMTREHWNGLVYVQQASTGVAAPALGPRPGERVLDLCAAPGGKTTHLCQLMEDRGCVVASEISEPRIRGLLGNVYRLAHPNVLVVSGDGRDFPEGALFDRVLVDAPCSGEGTLRRRSGSTPDQSSAFLAYVTGAQRGLLERAVRATRPGGVVLYVTCTFSPDENEAVVSEALGRLPVALEPLDLPVPHARGVTSFEGRRFDPRVEGAARIYPHHFDSGGLFLARLRVLGEVSDETAGRGWGPVPPRFPDAADAGVAAGSEAADRAEVGGEACRGAGGEGSASEAGVAVPAGVREVVERFGLDPSVADLAWTERGGRLWAHTVGEWPLGAWGEGSWRAVSLGIRAIDFDSRGRPRPTNDFLRWAGSAREAVGVDAESLRRLLGGEALPTDVERRGPVALACDGDVVGRGAVTVDGLKSEIAKARAKDLLRILEAERAEG